MRVLAIGDIHGCSKALSALLDAVNPTADDQVITLGDYVDWGPKAPRVGEDPGMRSHHPGVWIS